MEFHIDKARFTAPYTTRARSASFDSLLVGGQTILPIYATTFEHVEMQGGVVLTCDLKAGRNVLIEVEVSLRSNEVDRTGYPGTVLICKDALTIIGPDGSSKTINSSSRYPVYCSNIEVLSTTMFSQFIPPTDGTYSFHVFPFFEGHFWITASSAPTPITTSTGTPWTDVTVTIWP